MARVRVRVGMRSATSLGVVMQSSDVVLACEVLVSIAPESQYSKLTVAAGSHILEPVRFPILPHNHFS